MASEPRYIPSVENGAALHHAVLQKYGGVYFCRSCGGLSVVRRCRAHHAGRCKAPGTGDAVGTCTSPWLTKRKIDATPSAKLREMIKDPFVKQMVEAIYAAGE